VNIVTLAEGDITHLHVGLKGTMNALFLKDLADKTRPRAARPSRAREVRRRPLLRLQGDARDAGWCGDHRQPRDRPRRSEVISGSSATMPLACRRNPSRSD
jgi:hypothetical protein